MYRFTVAERAKMFILTLASSFVRVNYEEAVAPRPLIRVMERSVSNEPADCATLAVGSANERDRTLGLTSPNGFAIYLRL